MINISKLSINEQKEYLNLLKDRTIIYKNKLNFDSNITFGVEIEYENLLKDNVDTYLIKKESSNEISKGWNNKTEIDIATYDEYGYELNGEINSPILTDNENSWKSLKMVLSILKNNNGYVSDLSAGHIHIGSQILGNNINNWKNLLVLWMVYEDEIMRFCKGEFNELRFKQLIFAKKIDYLINLSLNEINETRLKLPSLYLEKIRNKIMYLRNVDIFDKHFSLHLGEIGDCKYKMNNSIEFRCPNATLDESIWQNNINFFVNLLLTCKKDLDLEKIMNNHKNKTFELADLIFNNQNDKDNFLIQSLKLNSWYNKELRYYIKR